MTIEMIKDGLAEIKSQIYDKTVSRLAELCLEVKNIPEAHHKPAFNEKINEIIPELSFNTDVDSWILSVSNLLDRIDSHDSNNSVRFSKQQKAAIKLGIVKNLDHFYSPKLVFDIAVQRVMNGELRSEVYKVHDICCNHKDYDDLPIKAIVEGIAAQELKNTNEPLMDILKKYGIEEYLKTNPKLVNILINEGRLGDEIRAGIPANIVSENHGFEPSDHINYTIQYFAATEGPLVGKVKGDVNCLHIANKYGITDESVREKIQRIAVSEGSVALEKLWNGEPLKKVIKEHGLKNSGSLNTDLQRLSSKIKVKLQNVKDAIHRAIFSENEEESLKFFNIYKLDNFIEYRQIYEKKDYTPEELKELSDSNFEEFKQMVAKFLPAAKNYREILKKNFLVGDGRSEEAQKIETKNFEEVTQENKISPNGTFYERSAYLYLKEKYEKIAN